MGRSREVWGDPDPEKVLENLRKALKRISPVGDLDMPGLEQLSDFVLAAAHLIHNLFPTRRTSGGAQLEEVPELTELEELIVRLMFNHVSAL